MSTQGNGLWKIERRKKAGFPVTTSSSFPVTNSVVDCPFILHVSFHSFWFNSFSFCFVLQFLIGVFLLFYFLQCLSGTFLLEPSSFSVTLSQRRFLWQTLPNSLPLLAGFICSLHLPVLCGILNFKDTVTPSFRVYILIVFQGQVSLLFPLEALKPVSLFPKLLIPTFMSIL